MTYYVSIGNSDDKLKQTDWALFQGSLLRTIQTYANVIHGVWYSSPMTAFQNMCIAFECCQPDRLTKIEDELSILASQYRQDSIAFAKAETKFIKGA